jgi:broad specificity phosphatase PhoE
MARGTIVLVRHGRSSHVVTGLLDLAGFRQWRVAYEAAGIDPADRPPPELLGRAETAGVLVSSDIRRATESARLLAGDREVIASPLLRELALQAPPLPWIRMPLLGWAVAVGVRWLFQRTHATPEEERRVGAAADWLVELADGHGDVLALTHASFRSVIAKELVRRGWRQTKPRRPSSHWSAWVFSRDLAEVS